MGFAYRLNDKTTIRGGYGMYYAGVAFSQFTGDPNLGFATNPTAANLSNGLYPAFLLDGGFPTQLIKQPPVIDPTIANGGGVPAVAPNGETLPRFQNWSLSFQRKLGKNLMLDLSYIGNHGSRLNHNAERAGIDFNMNDPSVLGLGAALLNSDIHSPAAAAAGIAVPYPGFNGSVAQALRKYPQYQNINWRGLPLGRSQYNAIEAVLEQHLNHGLQYRVGYTYSRLNNNGAESGMGNEGVNGGVQDPVNWNQADYGLSVDDVPHVFLVGFTWDIAADASQSWTGAKKAVLGGWNVAGVLRYESGRPLHISMANDMAGLLFNTDKRPNRTGADAVSAGGDFNPNTDNYFNAAGWQDPGPLAFGNAPRADGTVRGFHVYNEDLTFAKSFPIKGEMRIRFERCRQRVQPDDLLQSEHVLELRWIRHREHAVQPAPVGPVWPAARLLIQEVAVSQCGRVKSGFDPSPGTRGSPGERLYSACACCSQRFGVFLCRPLGLGCPARARGPPEGGRAGPGRAAGRSRPAGADGALRPRDASGGLFGARVPSAFSRTGSGKASSCSRRPSGWSPAFSGPT